jgi:hypothetical protein
MDRWCFSHKVPLKIGFMSTERKPEVPLKTNYCLFMLKYRIMHNPSLCINTSSVQVHNATTLQFRFHLLLYWWQIFAAMYLLCRLAYLTTVHLNTSCHEGHNNSLWLATRISSQQASTPFALQ